MSSFLHSPVAQQALKGTGVGESLVDDEELIKVIDFVTVTVGSGEGLAVGEGGFTVIDLVTVTVCWTMTEANNCDTMDLLSPAAVTELEITDMLLTVAPATMFDWSAADSENSVNISLIPFPCDPDS